MIPDSIRKMIDDEAKLFASDQVFNRDKFVEKLTEVGSAMGKWSYSLALKEIARLKEDVKELVECLDLIVGSMSLERVERFELNEKAKSLIQKHEQ